MPKYEVTMKGPDRNGLPRTFTVVADYFEMSGTFLDFEREVEADSDYTNTPLRLSADSVESVERIDDDGLEL